jgi:phosphoglucosamine mutase
MRKLFGTDGIRGVANVYPMTIEIAMQVGRAIAFVVKDKAKRHRIVIGKDTRQSCYMLENALVAGICSMGVDVHLVGPLPTPGIAFITTSMRADAGVVISASHNPFQDNGIKIFSGDGFKLPDESRAGYRGSDFFPEDGRSATGGRGSRQGHAHRGCQRALHRLLKNTFPKLLTLDGMHIVLDCAHGATYGVSPFVFRELGAKVTKLGVEPDGRNINDNCGALHPEVMAQKVKEVGADIGLALDGDGDRLIVCDEHGRIVDGDHIMAICAEELMRRRLLKKKTLVATVMSNMGLEVAMERMGGSMVRTAVGDRYVVECMRKKGYSFGGEQSGHLVFLDHITTGDGTLAALQLLAIMKKRKKPLSELARIMESYPQTLQNVRMSRKIPVDTIPLFPETLARLEAKLGKSGRILVRPSGTEPVIRVMVEGQDQEEITTIADELCEVIRKADRG